MIFFLSFTDGIALTPDASVLVYCPLTSRTLYRIDTALLRNFSTPLAEINNNVQFWFNKTSASDGLAFGNNWQLYATAIENSSVWQINPTSEKHITVMGDPSAMVWPDTLGIFNFTLAEVFSLRGF